MAKCDVLRGGVRTLVDQLQETNETNETLSVVKIRKVI